MESYLGEEDSISTNLIILKHKKFEIDIDIELPEFSMFNEIQYIQI